MESRKIRKAWPELLEQMYFTDWEPDLEFRTSFRKKYSLMPIFEAHNHYEALRSLAKAFSLKKDSPVIVIADTLPEQIKILSDGLSHANIGQRPFEMGYQAVRILQELRSGKKVQEYVYTGLDICTPETFSSCLSS